VTVSDVGVVGAGPAGLAAAIQLRRSGINPVVFEKGEPGGLLRNAGCIENYPGFPDGIPGEKLVELVRLQAERHGVAILNAAATEMDFQAGDFRLDSGAGQWRFRRVIVASGTKPKRFDFDIPAILEDKVHYEIASFLRESGKTMVIVGGGDAAYDYALTLAESNSVHILTRGDGVRCLPRLKARVDAHSRIIPIARVRVLGVSPDADGMAVRCRGAAGSVHFHADRLIGAIGRVPDLDFLAPGLTPMIPDLLKDGRLYFVGDVKNGAFRQTAIAAGDGLAAAMDIQRRMRAEGA
jgi:thioredoxin reductase (NADPH)